LEESLESLFKRAWPSWSSAGADLPFSLVVATPSIIVALRLLPASVVSTKFVALSALIDSIKAKPYFDVAIKTASHLSAREETVARTEEVPVINTPAQEIDIAAEGLVSALKKLFTAAINSAFPVASTSGLSTDAIISRCVNAAFGDYQCNNAMSLCKALKSIAGYTGLYVCFLCGYDGLNQLL
jgi:hypothetical protein